MDKVQKYNSFNTEALVDTSMEIGLKSKSREKDKNHNMTVNRPFKGAAKLKYIRRVKNQNCIHEESKNRLKLGLLPISEVLLSFHHLSVLKCKCTCFAWV
jgi:hypothetical protein